jgi:hypothetical protein
MLCEALRKYGESIHIHSRFPPDKLEFVGNRRGGNTYKEWFNGVAIPENELENYYVLYIYRNPAFSIRSRFDSPTHLDHIQCERRFKMNEILSSGEDLYKLREFYDNYTKENKNRNYKIYSIKYEDIFDRENQDELSKLLGIGKLNMNNKSKRKVIDKNLEKIYSDLINEMKNNKFITMS